MPKRYEERFPDLANGSMKKVYNSNMAAVDDAIGALLGALDTNNAVFGDSTVIVFSQDNGGPANASNNVPLRGAKFGIYEGGVRSNSFVSGMPPPFMSIYWDYWVVDTIISNYLPPPILCNALAIAWVTLY